LSALIAKIPTVKISGKTKAKRERSRVARKPGKRQIPRWLFERIGMGVSQMDGKFYYHDLWRIGPATPWWPDPLGSAPTLGIAAEIAEYEASKRQ
jgi:hypothetical protein